MDEQTEPKEYEVFDVVNRIKIDAGNIDDLRERTSALDQRAEIKVGQTVSLYAFRYEGGQRGDAIIFHDEGRGGICFGGDSDWGDVSGDLTLSTDYGAVYDLAFLAITEVARGD